MNMSRLTRSRVVHDENPGSETLKLHKSREGLGGWVNVHHTVSCEILG